MPTSPRIHLRTARASDLPLLIRHRRAMWEAIGGFSVESLDRTDRLYGAWASRGMGARRLRFWIAVDGAGAVAGSGGLWLADAQPRPSEPSGRRPYILSMFTEPRFRGRGVASRIVAAIVADATRRGHQQVTLHAAPMGRHLYASLGFERSWEMKLKIADRTKSTPRSPGARRRRG